MLKRLMATHAPAATLLIRLMVGAVFVSEGIQKFLFVADIGAGRFEKIGFSSPEATAQLVACFEIACGCLVLLGLLTRIAVIPLIVITLIFTYTLGSRKLSEVEGRLLKLLSGTMMLALGVLLVVAPVALNDLRVALALLTGSLAIAWLVHQLTGRGRMTRN